jgi:hypothetical protein
MTARRERTLPQKLADWQTAYEYVLEAVATNFPTTEQWYANRRTAAIVAAMLVGQNVKPVIVPEEE